MANATPSSIVCRTRSVPPETSKASLSSSFSFPSPYKRHHPISLFFIACGFSHSSLLICLQRPHDIVPALSLCTLGPISDHRKACDRFKRVPLSGTFAILLDKARACTNFLARRHDATDRIRRRDAEFFMTFAS